MKIVKRHVKYLTVYLAGAFSISALEVIEPLLFSVVHCEPA